MNEYTTFTHKVKSKAHYIAKAEEWMRQSEAPQTTSTEDTNALRKAQICATLAIAAPEASAPDDYLSVCRERDVLRSALRAVHEYFQMDVEYIHPEGLVQMVAIIAEPEIAE